MKPTYFIACSAAVAAIAGCNSNESTAATEAGPQQTVQQVAKPKDGDWSAVVQKTPAGGYLMGNPNAKVKLVEYASMTCPHCREFEETGTAPMIAKYVKPGKVSYEFRNYVRDPLDLAASLIARCNGPKQFFPLERALFKDQPAWFAKVQGASREKLAALQNLPPSSQFIELAKLAGFQQWAAMRGIPPAKANQCLSDQAMIDSLVQSTSDATRDYPDFPGTPTFVLNGKMLDKTASWDKLEPQLKAAVGG